MPIAALTLLRPFTSGHFARIALSLLRLTLTLVLMFVTQVMSADMDFKKSVQIERDPYVAAKDAHAIAVMTEVRLLTLLCSL